MSTENQDSTEKQEKSSTHEKRLKLRAIVEVAKAFASLATMWPKTAIVAAIVGTALSQAETLYCLINTCPGV